MCLWGWDVGDAEDGKEVAGNNCPGENANAKSSRRALNRPRRVNAICRQRISIFDSFFQ